MVVTTHTSFDYKKRHYTDRTVYQIDPEKDGIEVVVDPLTDGPRRYQIRVTALNGDRKSQFILAVPHAALEDLRNQINPFVDEDYGDEHEYPDEPIWI